MDRRAFLTASLAAGAVLEASEALAQSYSAKPAAPSAAPAFPPPDAHSVWLVGDTGPLTPAAYAARLAELTAGHDAADIRDGYLKGGAVEALERAFADFLGKEDCAFFPTGTLANNVALKVLCGDNHHALCHHESHLYLDESDAAQRLSGLNLVPLGAGRPYFTAEEADAAIHEAENGPYALKVGAITIESPVRRQHGGVVPFETVSAVAALAKTHGCGLHLDAARLLLAPPTLDLRRYVAPFDTVYVSLYKYLDASFGAVLAGSKARIETAREFRHLYGGLIYQGWPEALVALDSLKTFPARIARAHGAAAQLISALTASGKVELAPAADASNIYGLKMSQAMAEAAFERGRQAGVRIGRWDPALGGISLWVNDTLNRRPAGEYVKLFLG